MATLPRKRPVGRPTKFNRKVQGDIIRALEVGATYEIACGYAGISYGVFNIWMRRGWTEYDRIMLARHEFEKFSFNSRNNGKKAPRALILSLRPIPLERPFLQFFKAVQQSNGIAAVGWLTVIDTVAGQNPVWAERMLGYRYPTPYGGVIQKVEVSTNPDQPLTVNHSGEVDVKHSGEVTGKVDFDKLSAILGILADVGAIQPSSVSAAAGSDDPQDEQVHSDQPPS